MKHKVAIVTGAGRGIGKAVALTLAEAGANITAVARSAKQIEQTAEEVCKLGVKAIAIPADVTQEDQVRKAVEQTISHFGKVDVLCNIAGIMVLKPVISLSRIGLAVSGTTEDCSDEQLTVDDWHRVMETNLIGTFLFAQAVGPHMIKQKKGKVVNISSIVADEGIPHCAAYAGSKAAINILTRCLASEWAQFNINVNAVAPGLTKTEMAKPFLDDPKMLNDILEPIPLGRLGEPEEMASAVLFLASEASNYITGQILFVDGGVLGHGPEKV